MISVIIPVYKAFNSLEKCIESVINQKNVDLEIILINDGSPDDSILILKEYEKKYNNIIIVDKKNGGVSSARNAGLSLAKGEYITFIDSDDYYLDDKYIYNMFNILNTNVSVDIAVSGYTMITHGKHIVFPCDNDIISVHSYAKNFIFYQQNNLMSSPWNKLFRKSKIKNVFNQKLKMGEDAVFVLDYLLNCNNIAFCNNCGYGYIFENSSSTANFRKKVAYDIVQTNIYDNSIHYFLSNFLEKKEVSIQYLKIRTEEVYRMVSSIFIKKGIFEFLFHNINDMLDDENFYYHLENFHLINKKYEHFKLIQILIKKSKFKIKMYVLIKLIKNKIFK